MPSRQGRPATDVDEILRHGLADPRGVLRMMDKLDAEKSLLDFLRLTWPAIRGNEFKVGWAVEAVAEHLEAVTNGQITELIVNIPPGFSKSSLVSIWWPAWEWGPRAMPHLAYVIASYEQRLATTHQRDSRTLIKSDAYQDLWGDRYALVRDKETEFETDRGGKRYAVGIGGSMIGRHFNRLIVDDPHTVEKAESELERNKVLTWFNEQVSTRTRDENAAFVVVMQRLHENDLSGHILASELGFDHLCLPMEFDPQRRCHTSIGFDDPRQEEGELLFPELYPRTRVEKLKKKLSAGDSGTYACNPGEAPVLMSDLTLKPIREVKVGDELLGSELKMAGEGGSYGRMHVTRARVKNVFRRTSPVVKVHLDSGEVVRCTPDHRWFKRCRKAVPSYSPAKVGDRLTRMCPPRLPELKGEDLREAGWLGGFFDGDGSVQSCEKRGQPGFRPSPQVCFFQGSGRNGPNCERLEAALSRFGFEWNLYSVEHETHDFRHYKLKQAPALATIQKFLHVARPTKWVDRMLEGVLGAKQSMGKERVLGIEPDGEEEVFALETTTGNYVVWGLLSSNCEGQLQQRPVPRGGAMFERDKIEVIRDSQVPAGGKLVRGWDLAGSTRRRSPYTAGVLMKRVDNVTYILDVTRFRVEARDVPDKFRAVALDDPPETIQDVPQDPGSSGKAVASNLISAAPECAVYASTETGNKEDRAQPLAAQAAAGLVKIVEGPWNGAFLSELEVFPRGQFKDQVDAASRAYARIMPKRRQRGFGTPELIRRTL